MREMATTRSSGSGLVKLGSRPDPLEMAARPKHGLGNRGKNSSGSSASREVTALPVGDDKFGVVV